MVLHFKLCVFRVLYCVHLFVRSFVCFIQKAEGEEFYLPVNFNQFQ